MRVDLDRVDTQLVIESVRYLANECSLQSRRFPPGDPPDPVARQLRIRSDELHHLADKIQFDDGGKCALCERIMMVGECDRDHVC